MKNKEFMMLQLFADGDNNDMTARSFQLEFKNLLQAKRRRMADEGVCKSKRDKLNYLDVIADDKKLIEGYTAIVKELAIKYGVA